MGQTHRTVQTAHAMANQVVDRRKDAQTDLVPAISIVGSGFATAALIKIATVVLMEWGAATMALAGRWNGR